MKSSHIGCLKLFPFLVIVANTFTLALEDPTAAEEDRSPFLSMTDLVFQILYTIEMFPQNIRGWASSGILDHT